MAKKMSATRGPENNISLDKEKQKLFNQKVQKAKIQVQENPAGTGVVYISHLPWGFDEGPLRAYLKQFGNIKQLRISKSKKTGNSKGYGYVQFANDQVAKIVADSMNNYLMYGKLLKCKHLSNPHPKTFKNANRIFKKTNTIEKSVARHNAKKSDEAVTKAKKRGMAKCRKMQKKLAELTGVDYQLPCGEGQKMITKSPEDSDSDDEPPVKVQKTKGTPGKVQKTKGTPGKVLSAVPESVKHTPSRLKQDIPRKVDTPQGKMNVLVEDSSDEDISFKTPPYSIRSSHLTKDMTPSAPSSTRGTPARTAKSATKAQTPKSGKRGRGTDSPAVPVSDSTPASTRVTPGRAVKSAAAKLQTPKSGKRGRATESPAVSISDSTPTRTGKAPQTPSAPKTPKSDKKQTLTSAKKSKLKSPGSATKLKR